MAKSFELTFLGYYLEDAWPRLPQKSGIYCIYTCKYADKTDKVSDLTLVYIGEAENIRTRIPEDPPERLDLWRAELTRGEVLCASYAEIGPATDRKRAEAALIHHHKPACNKKYKWSFPFAKTSIRTKGKHADLDNAFTVERTTEPS